MHKGDGRLAVVLTLPVVVISAAFFLFPLLHSLVISFLDYDLNASSRPWVGLKNYFSALNDPRFRGSLLLTIFLMAVSIAAQMSAGLAIALTLNRPFPGRAVVRALILVPWAMPMIACAIIWKLMLNSQVGVVNLLLGALGLIDGSVNWLGPLTAIWSIAMVEVWKWTPLVVVLLLAGLQTIPRELYESASVDGASRLRTMLYVTLPMLKGPILIALLLRTIEASRIFDVIYAMTGGGPDNATKVATYLIYEVAFTHSQYGMGAAMAYLLTLMIMIPIGGYLYLLRREVRA